MKTTNMNGEELFVVPTMSALYECLGCKKKQTRKKKQDGKIEEYFKKLCAVPKNELPRIWNMLNNWSWPEELGEAPLGFVDYEYNDDIALLMRCIENSVDEKAIDRYHHLVNLEETEEEFEEWWDSNTKKEIIRKIEELRRSQMNLRTCFLAGINAALLAMSITTLIITLMK